MTCRPPRNDTVGQVLEHLGIFHIVRTDKKFIPERDDVIRWRHATGTTVDAASEVGPLLERTKTLRPDLLHLVFRGISEAMTNVSHHAYLRPRSDGTSISNEKRWWMFCREEDNRVIIGFCDLGLGIPVTLKEREEQSTLETILRSFNAIVRGGIARDAEMIKAAIELRKTRTKLSHQGKGLTDILRAVEESRSGYISIFSNGGCYTKRFDAAPPEVIRNYGDSIGGTLIFWSLPIVGSGGAEMRSRI